MKEKKEAISFKKSDLKTAKGNFTLEDGCRIRKVRRGNFTQLSNTIIEDDNLTYKARGLFGYLWSKPEGWEYNLNDIIAHATDGRKSIAAGIKELEKFGYVKRVQKYKKGIKCGHDYHLSDESGLLEDKCTTTDTSNSLKSKLISSTSGQKGSTAGRSTVNISYSNTDNTNTNLVGDKSPEKKEEKLGDREGVILANKFVDDILLLQPNLKIGNKRESFAKDFALMIRADDRSVAEIETIMGWLKTGSSNADFWKGNVLSGTTFRKQFDKLQIKMKQEGYTHASAVTRGALKEYLVKKYGKSRSFFSFLDENKRKSQVAFSSDFNVFANFNTGEIFEKKLQEKIWTHLLENIEKCFPDFKTTTVNETNMRVV